MDRQEYDAQILKRAELALEHMKPFLPKEEGMQKQVLEAMNYSFLAGGKRLRPLMMEETYRIFGGGEEDIFPFMAAIEMIHTYSLVHDDLPAMDDDSYRRGKLTTWKKYGEDLGVLAGDGLLNYAFETVLRAFADAPAAKMQKAFKALGILAGKAGVYGMIGGQTVDVLSEEREISGEELLFIHEHKTAALLEAALMIGAVMAGASEDAVAALEQCGSRIGLAFQIQDDILDVEGDSDILGKPVGSDAKNHKSTYVTLNGLEESKKTVQTLTKQAVEQLETLPGDTSFLSGLFLSLVERTK